MSTIRDEERDGEQGEGARAFRVDRPVDLATLDDELAEAMHWRFARLVAEGDPAEASPEAPVTIWCLRPDLDTYTFKAVVREHVPPTREAPEDPVAAVVAKADADEDLDPEEMQAALRHLLKASGRG